MRGKRGIVLGNSSKVCSKLYNIYIQYVSNLIIIKDLFKKKQFYYLKNVIKVYDMSEICGNSSVVEHHVANVRVASSNLVSRSKFQCESRRWRLGSRAGTPARSNPFPAPDFQPRPKPGFFVRTGLTARWQSGYAADCNSVYAGSIPTRASIPRPASVV